MASVLFGAPASASAGEDEVDQATLRAEKLAEQAEALVKTGAYAQAVELYLQATQSSPAAVLSFDIAWIYDEHLHAPALALEYYKKCLAAPDVDATLSARAKTRIEAIEAAAAAAAAAAGRGGGTKETPPLTAPSMTPPTGSPWPAMKTWALALGGAGVVGIGIGATFGVIAKGKDDDANQLCTGDVCSSSRALTLTDEAVSAAHVADVAFVAGAVLLAGGVALWLLAPRPAGVVVADPAAQPARSSSGAASSRGATILVATPTMIRGTW